MSEYMQVYWEYRYLKGEGLVKVYFLNGIPFTWDELEDEPSSDIIKQARECYMYSPDDLYRGSSYLMEESFHPLLDEINLDECSQLPD